MQICFGRILVLLAFGLFLFSCSSEVSEKEGDRSIIQQKQWQADSLEAQKLLQQLYPDSTATATDSLPTDSLSADSLRADSLLR